MKRYLSILAANFVIAMLVGVNASVSLIGGCVSEGQCGNGILDWALAIGAAVAALVCVGLAVYTWRRRPRVVTQHIKIPASRTAKAEIEPAEPEVSDDAVDASMSARLARMVSAAQVSEDPQSAIEADSLEPVDRSLPVEQADKGNDDADGDRFDDIADADDHRDADVVEPQREPVAQRFDSESTDAAAPEPASFDEPFRPTPPASRAMAMLTPYSEPDPEPEMDEEDAGEFGWLFDETFPGGPVRLLRHTGFPWALAGIDHVCVGVSRLGHRLAGTDFPSEAAAWRQVVAGLPRQQRLATEDGMAFVDWVNDLLDVCGPDGTDMVIDSLHELGIEAATDPSIAATLPLPLAGPALRNPMAMSSRFMK